MMPLLLLLLLLLLAFGMEAADGKRLWRDPYSKGAEAGALLNFKNPPLGTACTTCLCLCNLCPLHPLQSP